MRRTALSRILSHFGTGYTRSIATEAELRDYVDEVGWGPNLRRRGLNPFLLTVALAGSLFLLGSAADRLAVDSLFVDPGYVGVFAVDAFAFLFCMVYGERRFVEAILAVRPSFEVDDATYYGFFGEMLDVLYLPSFFSSYGYRDRTFLSSRVLLATALAAAAFGVFANAPIPGSAADPAVLLVFSAYHVLLALISGFAMFVVLWVGGLFTWFMGVRIASMELRLEVTRAAENLGLSPYGRFVLEMSVVFFLGLVVTGWSLVNRFNAFSALLTLVGTVGLPAFFVGSQYGIHRAIQRTKRLRLAAIESEYREDIDRWFSTAAGEPESTGVESDASRAVPNGSGAVPKGSEADPGKREVESTGRDVETPGLDVDRELVQQVRLNSLIALRDEIESLPEWPTRTKNFVEIGLATLISNVPLFLSYVV